MAACTFNLILCNEYASLSLRDLGKDGTLVEATWAVYETLSGIFFTYKYGVQQQQKQTKEEIASRQIQIPFDIHLKGKIAMISWEL